MLCHPIASPPHALRAALSAAFLLAILVLRYL